MVLSFQNGFRSLKRRKTRLIRVFNSGLLDYYHQYTFNAPCDLIPNCFFILLAIGQCHFFIIKRKEASINIINFISKSLIQRPCKDSQRTLTNRVIYFLSRDIKSDYRDYIKHRLVFKIIIPFINVGLWFNIFLF